MSSIDFYLAVMVAFKASAVAGFLKSPDLKLRAVLIYGPDAGLVTERAVFVADGFARRAPGTAEIVRLDDRDFAEDPPRLAVELQTLPMFADSKIVRVTAGARLDVLSLKSLLATLGDSALVVEAGNLRPDSALRKLFEGSKIAAALPCYSDDRTLTQVIDSELAAAGLSIDTVTRSYLMTRLGADQALSRSEVVKLTLYAQGETSITYDDIEAVVGDAGEIALENFVYAASSADASQALRELQRLTASGIDQAAALAALGRHFTQLHRVAAAQTGGNMEQAVKSLRLRPHFKRESQFLAHCRKWGAGRLAQALPLIQDAVRRTRRTPDLETSFAERLLLTLATRI